MLKELISIVVAEGPTFTELVEALDQVGVRVCVNASKDRRIGGLSFSLDDAEWMKGSSIGKAFSWRGLLNQGVTYVPDRDFEAVKFTASIRTLEQFTSNAKARPNRRAAPVIADEPGFGENSKDVGSNSERDPQEIQPSNVDDMGGAWAVHPQLSRSSCIANQIKNDIDPKVRKRVYKAKLLADFYKKKVSSELIPHIAFVDLGLNFPKVWFFNDIWVEDRGDCIQGSCSDRLAVKLMLDMAEAKGWEMLVVSGSDEFIERVLDEATMRGIPVAGYGVRQAPDVFGPR